MLAASAIVYARTALLTEAWSVLCWSLSFYPQPLMNWRRKSTQGFGIDFPTLNILGFLAYTVSSATMLWSPTIRSQYAARYPIAPNPTVRFNDFAFALHAIVLSIIIYSQFWLKVWGFKVGLDQKMSIGTLGIFWGNILGVVIIMLTVWAKGKDGGNDPSGWAWIDVVRHLHLARGRFVRFRELSSRPDGNLRRRHHDEPIFLNASTPHASRPILCEPTSGAAV